MASASRRYVSPLRDDQAQLTRQRIIDAARDLFLSQGYTATKMDSIAQAAGVSVQTVYNSIGNKSAVLAAVYDTTLAGDDAPIAIAERPTFQAMLAETNGRRCLARYAALSRELAERLAPLVATIWSERGNPDVRSLVDKVERQRAEGTAAVARHVADRFGLVRDLTVGEAADILWTLTAPDVMIRLVTHRRWSWERYEAWLANAMADAVLRRRR